MRLKLVPALGVIGLLVTAGASSAQITTVQSLTLERTLNPANEASTFPSQIPPTVMARVASGSLAVRESFVYHPNLGTVNYVQFGVPAGTPIPTPADVDISASTYVAAVLAVEKVSVGTNASFPSVQFTGTVASAKPGSLGSVTGTTGALSFGYTNATTFNNVLSSIGGVSSGYSADGVGQITLVQQPVPTTVCSTPVVIISPSALTTTSNFIDLNAAQSLECASQPLTYQWHVLDPVGFVTVYNPSSATPQARLNNGPGQYTFTVTATDPNGVSSTGTILVTYTAK